MRILVVTPWFPTADAPVSGVFVRREVEALAAVHEVTVVHLDWQRGVPLDQAHRGGFEYRHVPLVRSDPRAYMRARRVIAAASGDHDVVHTHALTGLLPWLRGRPGGGGVWVHSEHWSGITAPETLGIGERAALAVLGPRLRSADAVIAESTRLARSLGRFRAAPVDLVPCVVDSPTVIEPRDPHALRLLAVGGLIPRKGPLLAVAATATLVGRGVDATLTWVGEGPLHDEMLEEAARLGIADRVRLAGRLDDRGVSRELNDATMFLLPTQGDNFCVVAAEALVHGRPIVSGAATGAVDYAGPSVSRFVTTQSGESYADSIQSLARATESLSADEIAATVADRFTSAAVAASLTDIYRRVIRERTAPGDARTGMSARERFGDWVARHPASPIGRLAALRHGVPRRGDRAEVASAPDTGIRVLLGPSNFAGQATLWARALENRVSGLGARSLAIESAFGFPADALVAPRVFHNSRRWQRRQAEAARGFTHVLVESMVPPFGRLAGRDLPRQLALLDRQTSVAYVLHGTDVRAARRPQHQLTPAERQADRIAERKRALLNRLEGQAFVTTPDLLDDVPDGVWLPVVVDVDSWERSETEPRGASPVRVVHVPSSSALKGTALIEPVVQHLHETAMIEYESASGVQHEDMAKILWRADIVLDQFVLGSYGVAACEAMAAGAVVVGHVTASVRDRVLASTGLALPVVEATPDTLADVLRRLADDGQERARIAAAGLAFVRAVHDGSLSADILTRTWITEKSHRSTL